MPDSGPAGGRAPAAAVGSSIVRDVNTSRVLAVLRDQGPLAQSDLVRRTGLTRPTVAAIAQDLRARGVVVDAGVDRARTGRPATLLASEPGWATVAVCRVMGPVLEVVLADTDGTELRRLRRRHPGRVGTGLRALAAMITAAARDQGVPRPSAAALLLGARVDPVTGAGLAAAFGGGRPVSVPTVEERLGLPVTVLNPAAAAALGVAGGGSHRDTVVVFLDHGIGVGLVSSGTVLTGASGGTGELGHSRLPGRVEVCRCGRTGCLETVSAGWAIRDRVAGLGGVDHDHLVTLAELEALKDPEVEAVLTEAAWHLGVAASWVVNLLNPTTVLLGGSPFAAGAERFLATFAAAVRDHAVEDNAAGLTVAFATDRADVEGGVRAALDLLPHPSAGGSVASGPRGRSSTSAPGTA